MVEAEPWKRRRGPWARERERPREKAGRQILPSEPPEGTRPLDTATLVPWDQFRTSDLRNWTRINMHCVKPLRLW